MNEKAANTSKSHPLSQVSGEQPNVGRSSWLGMVAFTLSLFSTIVYFYASLGIQNYIKFLERTIDRIKEMLW